MPTGPLDGIKVVEIGQYGAAPLAAMLLGDYGADVVKVEPPAGDRYRTMPPFEAGESLYFAGVNRNKRGAVLDLRKTAAREALHLLLEGADILLENFRPGVMERLGIAVPGLLQRHPRLVVCSISGYGQDGPLRDEGAYDLIVQGWSGMMAATGEPDGAPVKLVPAVPDVLAAQQAAFACMMALHARATSGRGQHIDISLFDVSLYAHTLIYLPQMFGSGQAPRRLGSAHPEFVPNQAFRCADGEWITTGASDNRMWAGFCRVLCLEALVQDARFAMPVARRDNAAVLLPLVEAAFLTKSRDAWLALLREAEVPASPVCTLAEAIDSPQARHREMRRTVEHPTIGPMQTVGLPARLGATPGSIRRAAPRLGEHTEEILREAGLTAEGITAATA